MGEVYQIGVHVDRTVTTVLIVAIRADSREEAERRAKDVVRDYVYDADVDTLDAIDEAARWGGEVNYDVGGVSRDEYPPPRYEPDINLSDAPTEAEHEAALRQQDLPLGVL